MKTLNRLFFPLLALFFILLAGSLYSVFFYAPVERTMGIVQKIFYVHVPAAMAMYACYALTSLASFLYLIRPSRLLDNSALAGAELGSVFALYVLVSGPLWAYKAWGVAWTWDPQLTATLVLFLLYVGYLSLRLFAPDGRRIKRIAATIAVIAAVDIPVIHYSVRQWGGLHPVVEREGGGGLSPEMQTAFALTMVSFLLLTILLLWLRIRLLTKDEEIEALYLYLEDFQRSKRLGRR